MMALNETGTYGQNICIHVPSIYFRPCTNWATLEKSLNTSEIEGKMLILCQLHRVSERSKLNIDKCLETVKFYASVHMINVVRISEFGCKLWHSFSV